MAQEIYDKIKGLSPVASFVLAAVLVYTSFVGKTATTNEQTQSNTTEINALKNQVKSLQDQVAQQNVIAAQLNDVKNNEIQTQTDVRNLASEVHSWQREEYQYHHQKSNN